MEKNYQTEKSVNEKEKKKSNLNAQESKENKTKRNVSKRMN